MRKISIGHLKQSVYRFRNRFRPCALILLYHRIAETPSDPYLLNVTPDHFFEHLKVLKQKACLISLQQLMEALKEGNIPRRSVVITFDDGYADNFYQAEPLLSHYGIPATVFVTAGYMGQEQEFWWDELDRLLLQPGTLPKSLTLEVNGTPYQWDLGADAYYSEIDQKRDKEWHLYQSHDPSQRHRVFRAVHELLAKLPHQQRIQPLSQLATWASLGNKARDSHRIMSSDEVVKLDQGKLIEVGAHTMTHPVLSSLSASAQQEEILQSKQVLELTLRKPIKSFAYPHGSRSDYTSQTVEIAREAGFSCSCSNFPDMVLQKTDTFQLPRVLVYNWDKTAFAHHLQKYFDV